MRLQILLTLALQFQFHHKINRLGVLHIVPGKMTGLLNPQVATPARHCNICKDLPIIISINGKIYNYTGGNVKQLYITDPSEHKFW